jgi:antitoxin component YwqK of YwqJK toxin-antitoxin module
MLLQTNSYIKILDIVEGMDQGTNRGNTKICRWVKVRGPTKKTTCLMVFGIYYRPDGSKRYEGEFKTGNYHGKGIWYREDGTKWYEGEIVIGLRNGSGIEYAQRWGPSCMKVGIRITAGMAKALSSEQMGANSTKAISKIIKEMEKALNIKPMETVERKG